VRRLTKKRGRPETQEHGYEVDLVGARQDALVLASVKSFFGSKGVAKTGFRGLDDSKPKQQTSYLIFNEADVREGIINQAAERYGYDRAAVQLRLYVGNFAKGHELAIRQHLKARVPPATVVGLAEIIEHVERQASSKTYRNDPVVVMMKVLKKLGWSAPTAKSAR